MHPYSRLRTVAETWAGKQVAPSRRQWSQTESEIIIPEGDEEGLLHEIAHWVVATDTEKTEPNLMLYDWESEFEETVPPPPWWSVGRTVPRREFEAVRLGHAAYQAAGRIMPGYAAVTWAFLRNFEALPKRVQRSIDKTWRRRVSSRPGLYEALIEALIRRPDDQPDPYYTTLTRHITPPEPGGFLRQIAWGYRCLHCGERVEGHLCNVVPRHGGGSFRCVECTGEMLYHPVWVRSVHDDDVVAGWISRVDSPTHFTSIDDKHVGVGHVA